MSLLMPLKPKLSEKAYGLSQTRRTYIFEVPKSANKETIADAVAAQFKVTVTNINLANQKGKTKRTVRKGGRPIMGRRSDVKRAYITVKQGDSIPVFAAIEEASKPEETKEQPKAKKEKK
jgi:large subunit ribosomal protein L23